jgi:hypothetical protein
VDPDAVEADLDLLDASVAIEAWWWTGEVAADFANPVWLDRAAGRLHAGPHRPLSQARPRSAEVVSRPG